VATLKLISHFCFRFRFLWNQMFGTFCLLCDLICFCAIICIQHQTLPCTFTQFPFLTITGCENFRIFLSFQIHDIHVNRNLLSKVRSGSAKWLIRSSEVSKSARAITLDI